MNRSKGKARPKTSNRKPTIAKRRPAHAQQRRTNRNGGSSNSYIGALRNALGGVSLGHIGNVVGGSFGGPAGMALGGMAGRALGRITGLGSYKVNQNSLVGDNGPPMFGDGGENGTLITKREFLQDVTGSTAFTLQSFAINPGLVGSFPWLSQIAPNYEQYRMEGLIFEFKSTSANALNSTNTALGTVIMSTNYDTLDSNFQSKQQMEAYEFTTSCVPSLSSIHPIECKPRLNSLTNQYIRPGAVPSGGDQRFYDVGNFQIATSGMQAAAVIGELWVSYRVRLLKPKLQTPLGGNLLNAHIRESPANSAAAAASKFLGTTGTSTGVAGVGTLGAGSNIPVVTTANTFTIPIPGRFLITSVWTGGVTVVAALALGTNITAVLAYQQDAVSNERDAVTATVAITTQVVDVAAAGTGAANTITISGLTNLATGTADIYITQISSGTFA